MVALLTLAAATLTARLGVWQLDRAAQKRDAQHTLEVQRGKPPLPTADWPRDAAELAATTQRAVVAQGRWDAEDTVFLENRPMGGRTGFIVVTPLVMAGGASVLVQRGWLPRDAVDRTRIGAFETPPGEVTVRGRIAPPPGRLFELGDAAPGAIRQNLDLQSFGRDKRLRLRPFTIVQEDAPQAPADGLVRQWPQPAADVHKNYGYAFQWFALCALIVALYVWFQLLRPRRGVS